ncbi:MAG: efflux RND transporter periplasmic adaptor subunit [Candidatus Pacebacteria bacterium]|nr:efflux RND transporter periplasmic adaptor subunit [Candidatus Paceibacterota bacterium]
MSLISFFGTRKWLIVASVVVFIAVGVYFVRSGGGQSIGDIEVKRSTILETVAVTGSIEPADAVELSFQNSGRVSRANVRVGDRVAQGQTLASLDVAELSAQLRDAQATVLAQSAKLQNIQGGGRAEEIAIQESDVRSAQLALAHAYEGVYGVLTDAFTKADNAMRAQLYPLFTSVGNDGTPQYVMTVSCQCDVAATSAVSNRAKSETYLIRWKAELSDLALHGTPELFMRAMVNAESYLNAIRATVNAVGTLLDDTTLNQYTAAATVQEYRTRVVTARTAVDAASLAVTTRTQLIGTNESALERAERALALTKAGSTKYEIDAQQASLLSAQAQVERYEAQIAKSLIRSPIDGIVTRQDAKLGQNATANAGLIEVISDKNLQIESYIPEVDIGKVAVGDKVKVAADAFPTEVFQGQILFVDPAKTIIDGVVKFKVIMSLAQEDARFKSGLTVNLDIITQEKSDVIVVPQFTIIENDEGTFVQRVTSSGTEKIMVQLGIRDQSGMVEVVSGLNEHDLVQNIGLKTSQ